MRAIDADRLLDRCKFYHMPNGDIAVPIIDVQHAPTIETESHWIPVTERLPRIGEYVLCTVKQPYRGRFHVCKYVDKDKWHDHPYFDWWHNGFPDVVAWMPLPEPLVTER